MQSSFQFVVETGTGKPEGFNRTLVRAHVKRRKPQFEQPSYHDFISTDRQAHATKYRKSSTSSDESVSRTKTARNASYKWRSHHAEAGLRNSLNPNTTELNSLLSNDNSHSEKSLINHFNNVTSQTFYLIKPNEQFVSYAVQENDLTLLHSILALAAVCSSALRGSHQSPKAIYHMGKAIVALKSEIFKVADCLDGQLSDATICAVALLTSLECLSVRESSVHIHMNGLDSMIKSRGGLQSLTKSNMALSIITWVDSTASIILKSPPRFSRLDSLETILTDDVCPPPTLLALRYASKINNLTSSSELTKEMMKTLGLLRLLTSIKESNMKRALKNHSSPRSYDWPEEIETFSDKLERLERRAVSLVQNTSTSDPKLAIFYLFGNAALLQIYMFMRDFFRGAPILHLISSRIQDTLQTLDTSKLLLQYPELYLWILTISGLGAVGSPKRVWFATQLARGCQELGIRSDEELSFALEEFFWSELYLCLMAAGFWNEVSTAQGVDGGYKVKGIKDHILTVTYRERVEEDMIPVSLCGRMFTD